jgi:hypothetical protein
MIRLPQREGPQYPVRVTRTENVGQGIAMLGTRSPHFGPRALLRCVEPLPRGSPEQTETTCTPTTTPNGKAADRIWRPNKYRCLPTARLPQKGGVGVRLAAFSSGWKGSSYPHCVGGVVANLGYVRAVARAIFQRRTEGRETMAACRAVPRRDPDPLTTVIQPRTPHPAPQCCLICVFVILYQSCGAAALPPLKRISRSSVHDPTASGPRFEGHGPRSLELKMTNT